MNPINKDENEYYFKYAPSSMLRRTARALAAQQNYTLKEGAGRRGPGFDFPPSAFRSSEAVPCPTA
jgi:hypothetical protein